MKYISDHDQLTPKLIDGLYVEAMVLADEARSYFDTLGRDDRLALDPLDRVGFSCESLKVTTRLMHVIAWLLTQRAVAAGELSRGEAGVAGAPARRRRRNRSGPARPPARGRGRPDPRERGTCTAGSAGSTRAAPPRSRWAAPRAACLAGCKAPSNTPSLRAKRSNPALDCRVASLLAMTTGAC